MTYETALRYLNSFINYENFISFDYNGSLKLDRMKRFAAMLGNPQQNLRCIHITGTKGKGSTCAMVASILKEAGFKVGLYTSPHLISFRERVRINDELISKKDLCGLLDKIKSVTDAMDKTSDGYPTFFEVYTALAFLYFKQNDVDISVLEVGMGGRLDATNIIERPLCCGITQISYEHTQKLGNTLAQIATEKAGIIKEGSVCISSSQNDSARDVIRKICKDKGCLLYEVGQELLFKEEDFKEGSGIQRFSVSGIFGEYPFLEMGLLGTHQRMNAATAIGIIESLRFHDIMIDYNTIRGGLKNVNWPGRLQVLRKAPYIVLDGAQNRASARALAEAVKRFFHYDKLVLMLGISKDKDIKGICEELVPISDEIILTKASLPRAEEPDAFRKYTKKEARITAGVKEALDLAEGLAGHSDLILITGSLFVVGEVLNMKAHLCKNSVLTTQ